MSNTELQKETAIQCEQQSKMTEKILKELQDVNKNLQNLTDAIWHLSQYGINTRNS